MQCGGADQAVAAVAAGTANEGELRVLAKRIVQAAVAGGDLVFQGSQVDQGLAGEGVHPRHEFAQVVLDDEVDAVALECLHRSRGGTTRSAAQDLAPALVGQVGVLLGARRGRIPS